MGYDAKLGDADPRGAGAHQRVELLDGRGRAGSASLCAIATTSLSRAAISPSFSIRSSVRSPTAPSAEQQPRARAAYAVHDLEQRLEPGLVVGEVDDDRDLADREEVHPAGVVLGVGAEGPQPLDHHVARDADRERRRGRGQGVLDVEARQPGQRHRHVDQLDQRVRVGVGREHRDPAVDHGRRPAAGAEHLADRRASRGRGRTPTAAP